MPQILNYANELENSKKSQNTEAFAIQNIIDSHKFKLVKNIGNIYENISKIFNIDNNKFDGYQTTIEKINEHIDTNKKDVENNINNITSLNVFIRESELDFEDYEYTNRQIDIKVLSAIKIAFLEYDEKFEILKKDSIAEMKLKACSLFRVNLEDYMLIGRNLNWIPFNLDVYQEIFMINLNKKCIDSSCRFYQFNTFISVKYSYINFSFIQLGIL